MLCAGCGFVIERVKDSYRGFSTGDGRVWHTDCLINWLKLEEK